MFLFLALIAVHVALCYLFISWVAPAIRRREHSPIGLRGGTAMMLAGLVQGLGFMIGVGAVLLVLGVALDITGTYDLLLARAA